MGGKKIRVLIVAVTILLVLLSIAAESAYFSGFEYRYRTRRFNKILHKKEKIIEECLKGIRLALESSTNEPAPTRGEEKLFKIAAKNGITILEYVNDRLVYWSDNEFNVPGIINTGFYDNSLISIQNGWFLSAFTGCTTIMALKMTLLIMALPMITGFLKTVNRVAIRRIPATIFTPVRAHICFR